MHTCLAGQLAAAHSALEGLGNRAIHPPVQFQQTPEGPAPAPYAGPPVESAAPIEINLQQLSPMLPSVGSAPIIAPDGMSSSNQTCEELALGQLSLQS